MTFKKDTLYQQNTQGDADAAVQHIVDFAFDDKVASVFPDMVHRSVPGYSTILRLWQAVFACEFTDKSVHVLDLGCSLGAVTLALADVLPNARFTAIDASSDMLSRCRMACEEVGIATRVSCQVADIVDYPLNDGIDAVTLNLVMQFIAPDKRDAMIQKYVDALPSGGLLAITEKVRSEHADTEATVIRWHEQFKRNNGYSELEIASKRTAIEDIMRIDTPETIETRLRQAGLSNVMKIAQNLSFCSWIAIKP